MRIEIDNKTWFNSSDIRQIVKAALKAEGIDRRTYLVQVRYSRRSGEIGGLGWYHLNRIKMTVPKYQWTENLLWQFTPDRVKTFAQVMVHEFGHNLGLRHKEMCGVSDIDVSWCEGMQIRISDPPKKETSEERSAKREAKARVKVQELEREIKRKQNLLKKWKTKVRYYDKKKAAKPKDEHE